MDMLIHGLTLVQDISSTLPGEIPSSTGFEEHFMDFRKIPTFSAVEESNGIISSETSYLPAAMMS
jgi:hypothetical protein